ncbi:hypothetical protein [Xanthovirga aplysinae]|uniref:hypothetical protein n=1 Tax=Xanthovirga aplysinae TaxID=2529853 RepID=UPI0012BC799E|nr:hypothetical protein [Xanthovirga aplysinae]MTI33347.1 hypothetical protein [Xanthovirga aplysinae]
MALLEDFQLKELQETAKEYQQALRGIKTRRNDWQKNIKKLIKRTLTEISEKIELSWSVGDYTHKKNLESIYLSFENIQSGITKLSEEGEGELIKYGGYLCYSQASNGKIHVWMEYPMIEKIKDIEEKKVVAVMSPMEISSEIILSQVESFLKEMVRWERDYREIIGFKINAS